MDVSCKTDDELADLILELTDEMGARSAQVGIDGRHYSEAEIHLDHALEAMKQ